MPKALIEGVEISYRQVGSGDDIVLVHGMAANHAFWNLNLLLPLARDYRVTTYDLRGHGYSEMPPRGYTSADLAEDLVGLLDECGIERAHLVGHSFGGVVVMHCAVMYPERVASLTIQDSRIRALQPTQRLRDWPDWREAQARLRENGIEIDENEDGVGLRLLEALAAPEWRERRQRLAKQPVFVPFAGWAAGNRSAERWLKLLGTTTARSDIQQLAGLTLERLRAVQQPILAIYGERSRCLGTLKRMIEVLPDCSSRILADAGHFYPVIQPALVAELIIEFLRGLDRAEAPGGASRCSEQG